MPRLLRPLWLLLIVLIVFSFWNSLVQGSTTATASAAAIYVDGATGNDANGGTSAAPYKTIAKANSRVSNGGNDTVYIRSGVLYAEPLVPEGFAKNNLTYIAWNKTGDDPLRLPPIIDTGADLSAFHLMGRHDITIDGFFFRDPGYKWGVIDDSYNIRLRNSFFDQAPDQLAADPVYSGLDIFNSSHHITLYNNHFNRWNQPRRADGTEGNGDMIWVMGLPKNRALPSAQNPGSHHILLDRNFFDGFNPANPKADSGWGNGASAGHALLNIEGRWNVVRDNVFFNLSQKNVDAISYVDRRADPLLNGTHDGTRLLFEGNHFKRATTTTNPAGGGGLGLGLAAYDNIVRFNKFDRNERAGLQIGAWGDGESTFLVPAITGNHVYHNTFYHNGYVPAFLNKVDEDAITMFDFRPQSLVPKNSHNNEFRNNLFYDNAGGVSDDGYSVSEGMTQMQFYLRHDDGSFGLNQNFIISNLFYRASGAAGNEILIHAGLRADGLPQFRYHLPANEWNDQDGPLLGNEWLIRDNLVADPLLNTTTLAPRPGSPAIGTAWALAYALNAGTNSLTLQVNDAHWFSDGFDGLVEADTIRLGGTNGPVVKIANINDATNVITLAAPATWPNDVQIYLYQMSDSTRVLFDNGPDIGAVQFAGSSASTPTPTNTTLPPPTPAASATVTPRPTPTPTPTTTSSNPLGDNLIQNGDFSQGEAMWSIGGIGMSYGFAQNQLCLTFAQPIPNLADAGVSQTGLLLEAGKRYRLTGTVWSQSAATIKVIVGESQPPWQNYTNQLISLAAGQTQPYSYEFTMNGSGDPHAGLFFHVGGHTSPKLCLDNLEVRKFLTEPTATPTPTSTPSGATTGKMMGSVRNESGVGLSKIRVYAYRLAGSSWRQVKQVSTMADGTYQLTQLSAGAYRLRFFDPKNRYRTEFFDNAKTLKSAGTLTLPAGGTLTAINAVLAPAQVSRVLLSGSVAYGRDEETGQLQLNAWPGSQFTVTYPASCGNTDAQVQGVTLSAGAQTFTMTTATVPNPVEAPLYRVDLQVPTDLAAGDQYALAVRWNCVAGPADQAIGAVQTTTTFDTMIGTLAVGSASASGQAISLLTGQPLADALVTLYRVPDWRPRTDPSDNTPNTCESALSKAADAPWRQPVPDEAGEWLSGQTDETLVHLINPPINPQFTGTDGRFTWTVSPGCWYVEVEAEGYLVSRGPLIGITAEVGMPLPELVVAAKPENILFLPLVAR